MSLDYTDSMHFADYSALIDARSPAEYDQDHLPGAINLPVLDDAERAQIGKIYTQVSSFAARRLGAAMVSRNIAALLTGPLADKPAEFRPLIYCWRGGMRSKSLAIVLRQIGWQAVLLDGGYKRYRKWVRSTLETTCESFSWIKLAGLTGCGKTRMLQLLGERGCQVLDLEALARHQGSLLGAIPGNSQPGQKYFETLLVDRLRGFDPAKSIWVESESSKIGELHCPAPLWQQMRRAQVVELSAPRSARVEFLLRQYSYFFDQPEILKQSLAGLVQRHGRAVVNQWSTLIDTCRWDELVDELLQTHYDIAYRAALANNSSEVLKRAKLDSLSESDLTRCADRLSCEI